MSFLETLKGWLGLGVDNLESEILARKPPQMPTFSPAEKQHILDGMTWFKEQFGQPIELDLQNLPFTLDLLTAIAVQETFEVWGRLFNATPRKSVAEILFDCVGDPLDVVNGRGSNAWPADRAQLEAWPQGDTMFQIGRESLATLARINPAYEKWANNPDKFCHAYGIFQYDIQFFQHVDPNYFLNKSWGDFALCLAKCIDELTVAWKRYYPTATSLTDAQLVYVAIAYNNGSANIHGDFNQGWQDGDGVYYGQYINTFLGFAKTTAPPVGA